MRNGTPSDTNKLVLVGNYEHSEANVEKEITLDHHAEVKQELMTILSSWQRSQGTLSLVIAVSLACLTAAAVTGSYAIWLSRYQSARQALIDVNDILKSCQARMQQLEADVQQLPERRA